MGHIIKALISIVPEKFLLTGTKMVNGRRLQLNKKERLELLERNLTHKFERILNKYSPIKQMAKLNNKRKLDRGKNQFYCLMGQIALMHAAIEQDVKNTLICDWDVPQEFPEKYEDSSGKSKENTIVIERQFGERLKKRFFKELKRCLIPQNELEEYKELYGKFWKLSDRRNTAIKSIYSFNEGASEISRIHEKHHANFNGEVSYEELLSAWLPKINLKDMYLLLKELTDLRGEFNELRFGVYRNKIKLFTDLCSVDGQSYPQYAIKNPYLYEALLK